MGNLIRVGMADMNVCCAPDRITTLGLGSCVGVTIYDPVKRICGMVHIMLPNSMEIINRDNPAKFADTGINMLYNRLLEMGVNRYQLKAKMAGGAQMFGFISANENLRVGKRNAEASERILKSLGIRIEASDCGGNYGRTIEFDPETSKLYIRAIGRKEIII